VGCITNIVSSERQPEICASIIFAERSRYTLDEIAEAPRYADTGHKIGNVAVLIGIR
jgi:hypothetical protein